MRFAVVLLLVFLAVPAHAGDLATLVAWLSGSFSSAAQAEADSAYYDIRLEMVPIWPECEDGHWLYVEQAVASALERPYRQRAYHVTALADGSFKSEVYALPDPLRFAGAWRDEQPLSVLTADSLRVREGCAVILRRVADDLFAGSTVENQCTSQLRGATYATSEIEIGPQRLSSWDRGLDASDEQVWGAEAGPYQFLRVPPTPVAAPVE